MADCRALAERLASWNGSVVPARVNFADGSWSKSSIKGWPAKASADPSQWRRDWFTWGGSWWVACCPRVGGLVAMDLDGPEAVEAARVAIKSGDLPWTGDELVYTTPGHGGGLHTWWRWPPSLPAFSRLVAQLPAGGEVDLRGEAGFVLMYGAPRPDIPGDGLYELVHSPGIVGPPPAPPELQDWVRSLGPSTLEEAPVHAGKQLDPKSLPKMAEAQGGKIKQDRHSTLFRICSWLRVRKDFNTFETLATELWRLAEEYFDIDEEVEHWQSECIRVAKNARQYTQDRDQAQLATAEAGMRALGLSPTTLKK